MSSITTSRADLVNAAAQRHRIPPRRSNASPFLVTIEGSDLLYPQQQTINNQQSRSTPHHDEQPHNGGESEVEEAVTPQYRSRRESVMWNSGPADGDAPKYVRNPLPPQQPNMITPPPLEKLLHQTPNQDADSAHNARLAQPETFSVQPPATHDTRPSTPPVSLSRRSTGGASIIGFKRGVTKQIHDMNDFFSQELTILRHDEQTEDDIGHESSDEISRHTRKERKLSFILPLTLSRKTSIKPTQVSIGPTNDASSMSNEGVPVPISLEKGSLKDRRRVDFELSLPIDAPIQVAPDAPPFSNLTSFTPSRPRSPKTPWVRPDPVAWQRNTKSRATPIVEEDYIGQATVGVSNTELGLLPGTDTVISSSSQRVEYPKLRMRNRNMVRRSGRSETSEAALAQTPDRSWTPEERQVHMNAELRQLGQMSKRSRSARWRWTSSTQRSSDEASPTGVREPIGRRLSINPFKRSDRITDRMNKNTEKKKPTSPGRFWWIGKQTATTPSTGTPDTISNMSTPPIFVPPGLQRIPTPPLFDVNGEVKGKLADFFFDYGNGTTRRTAKPKHGGHWDSDALLMSYISTDKELDNTEDEGPGDPLTSHGPSRPVLSQNTSYGTPGLVTAPGDYMDAKDISGQQQDTNQRPSTPEVWFRVHHQEYSPSGPLSAEEMKEMYDRRKFEWVVAEHLPNSPLCPLHPKYQGYAFGMCYWHKKKREMVEDDNEMGSSGEYEGNVRAGVVDGNGWEARKRRLISLSSP